MDTRTNAVVQMILNQRNNALDTVANLTGEIEVLKEQIKQLTEDKNDNTTNS